MTNWGNVDRRTAVAAAVVAVVTVEMEAVVVDGEDATYVELCTYLLWREKYVSPIRLNSYLWWRTGGALHKVDNVRASFAELYPHPRYNNHENVDSGPCRLGSYVTGSKPGYGILLWSHKCRNNCWRLHGCFHTGGFILLINGRYGHEGQQYPHRQNSGVRET